MRLRSKFSNNPIYVIFLTVFIDLLGFGILIPVIPLLLANPESPSYLLPPDTSRSVGYLILALLTAIFPLMQFLAAPVLGQLSDKYGRKKVLAFSISGTCLSYVLFAIGVITKNIPLLFLSRGLDGVTGGNISVAQAAIADVTSHKERAKNFGLIGVAFGIGFIAGPYLGGKLSDPSVLPFFNVATPFWFAAILSAINVVWILNFFPETLKIFKHEHVIKWSKSVKNIFHAFSMKDMRPLFLTVFLLVGGFTFFTTFFGVYLVNKFNFTQGSIGDFYAYIGLWVIFAQGFVIRQVSKKFKDYQILRFTLFGVSLMIALYFFPTVWWQLLFIAPFMAIFNGLSQANLTSAISNSVGPEIQGEIMGVNSSIQAFAQFIPAILSGVIAVEVSPSTPIVVASIMLFSAGITMWLYYKPVGYEKRDYLHNK